ncbi:MAG TPA: cytochrome c/FTR1 family iron permease [Gemmatimonadales bacterium]|nr:cytochrome c/FTR1 family iron permease [Gemmatimonadales bacterium]
MVLNGGAVLFLAASFLQVPQQSTSTNDLAPAVRRLAATAQLAAQEYRVGMEGGRVVSQAEVDEARMFLQESRRSAADLPEGIRREVTGELDSLIRLVQTTASPDSIDARILRFTSGLSSRLGIALDEIPARTPVLTRGAEVYQADCASCHGAVGRGDGPGALGLDPKPADLSNAGALLDRSPLDYYRRVTIGVVGTAMPAYEVRLSPQDRWAVALYASVLRLPPPSGEVPSALRSFPTTGRMSDADLLKALDSHGDSTTALARIAAIRTFQPDATAGVTARVFHDVRAQLESTYVLARTGDSAAGTRAFDAYMTFEQVERGIRAKNPALAAELESSFAALRAAAAGGVAKGEVEPIRRQLALGLEKAERTLGDQLSPSNLFFQSFVILVREGLEAILIVGALITFLVKMGASERKRDINLGILAAVGASLATAIAIETVFQLTPSKQEALEGVTMMLATVMLFYVSYWLLSKMEVIKWNHFVKSKVHSAVTSGSSLALASAAFLAVYREGFETILFYKALFLSAGPTTAGSMPIAGGMLIGAAALVAIYVAISRFGVRLPLKPFFAATSALLYYMAFVFAGKGVAELQEGGLVSITIVPGGPRVPVLGIYPTVESLVAQGLLLALLLGALVWTFVIEPSRPKLASFAVAKPASKRELVE